MHGHVNLSVEIYACNYFVMHDSASLIHNIQCRRQYISVIHGMYIIDIHYIN